MFGLVGIMFLAGGNSILEILLLEIRRDKRSLAVGTAKSSHNQSAEQCTHIV